MQIFIKSLYTENHFSFKIPLPQDELDHFYFLRFKKNWKIKLKKKLYVLATSKYLNESSICISNLKSEFFNACFEEDKI